MLLYEPVERLDILLDLLDLIRRDRMARHRDGEADTGRVLRTSSI